MGEPRPAVVEEVIGQRAGRNRAFMRQAERLGYGESVSSSMQVDCTSMFGQLASRQMRARVGSLEV
jgi:hypothetical protein